MRMCRMDPKARYSAEEALTHPWITRDFLARVPLSYNDYLVDHQLRRELVDVARLLVFLSHLPSAERVFTKASIGRLTFCS